MRALYWLAGTALLFGLYLLYAGISAPEAMAGAGAEAVAAARGTEHPRFLPHAAWLARAARLPYEIARDNALLARGRAEELPGEPGSKIKERPDTDAGHRQTPAAALIALGLVAGARAAADRGGAGVGDPDRGSRGVRLARGWDIGGRGRSRREDGCGPRSGDCVSSIAV